VSRNPNDTGSAFAAAAISPNDSTNIPVTAGIYVGGAGSVVVVMNGATVTFVGVPAGAILPIRATRVTTASTATNMVALY